MIEAPELLRCPEKLVPVITGINDNKYFLIEGGRGSGKTQFVARFLLYLADQKRLRIFCGREVQISIADSVHAVLADLVRRHNLPFRITREYIQHLENGSNFKFKGFHEHGSENLKGLEGTDIVWVDEAQMLSQRSLDVLIPTIRKENCKLFFTFNRFMRDDPVMQFVGRDDALHIKCNFFDNPFCPQTLKIEAENCKAKSEREYAHIWLGEPLAQADDYLFNVDKLWRAFDVKADGVLYAEQRVMGIDFAAQGNDSCVAIVLDRRSSLQWALTERIRWDEPDGMASVGRIVNLVGKYRPDVVALDVGGMGHIVHNRLAEIGLDIKRFDGASTDGVDTGHYVNARANGYWLLADAFGQGNIIIKQEDKEVIKQLEKIKMKHRSDGRRILEKKVDMKAEIGYSPDDADALMIAFWAVHTWLGKTKHGFAVNREQNLVRKSGSRFATWQS